MTKKYAKKMENLARVRDGSEKEIGWGYWLNVVVGAEIGGKEIVPLVHDLSADRQVCILPRRMILSVRITRYWRRVDACIKRLRGGEFWCWIEAEIEASFTKNIWGPVRIDLSFANEETGRCFIVGAKRRCSN